MSTHICRHIKTNGDRCGSPALAGMVFCYFHRNLIQHHTARARRSDTAVETIIHPMLADGRGQREPLLAEYFTDPRANDLHLPPLEDRESIQVAISMLVGALAANRLDPARASTLLYGLQVASSNCNRLNLKPSRSSIVTETVLMPTGEEVAPDEDPQEELDYQQYLACLGGNCTCDDHDDEAEDA